MRTDKGSAVVYDADRKQVVLYGTADKRPFVCISVQDSPVIAHGYGQVSAAVDASQRSGREAGRLQGIAVVVDFVNDIVLTGYYICIAMGNMSRTGIRSAGVEQV